MKSRASAAALGSASLIVLVFPASYGSAFLPETPAAANRRGQVDDAAARFHVRGTMGGTQAHLDRRRFLAAVAGLAVLPFAGAGARESAILRPIPASGERIPAIGMGTWITFNVGDSEALRRRRLEVLRAFFERGGGMVDSSPMYGSSEAVLGWCLARLDNAAGLFAATKVWTPFDDSGPEQMAASRRLWGRNRFDLVQVHNLVNWEAHLEMLLEAKRRGQIRYVGVTTSHGSRHGEMERIMRAEPIDFAQCSYNILDREAERRLLPLAAERGLAVIVNRPFRQKQLFRLFGAKPLPAWSAEFDAGNWAQFFLKFAISHPAVSCAIPATSRPDHMAENMGALYGRLPDAELRRRMVGYVESL
jgi:diketogulonate reductase-like aldo/keto reductase